jgi:hypothetical protein
MMPQIIMAWLMGPAVTGWDPGIEKKIMNIPRK